MMVRACKACQDVYVEKPLPAWPWKKGRRWWPRRGNTIGWCKRAPGSVPAITSDKRAGMVRTGHVREK